MKVGILGGGQLARMLALAGYPLGIHTLCYDPAANVCAADVTQVIQADYADQTQLQRFAEQVDVITFETENIPLAAAEIVSQIKPVYPTLAALRIGQDRWLEKNFFRELAIPTPQFAAVNTFAELEQAVMQIGCPAVLKTTRMGYDGKGQFVIKQLDDLKKAWALSDGQPLILEQFIPFERECSLIAVRSQSGDVQFYPLVENQHREGILRISKAPFADAVLQRQAEKYGHAILNKLDYVGIFVLELFQQGNQLLANEMAPRVHNSGHWTIEGAVTSQFENHLRAIGGWPLGSTMTQGYSIMFNIIGHEPDIKEILRIPAAHYHTYKKQPRANRKLGHVTINVSDQWLNENNNRLMLRALEEKKV